MLSSADILKASILIVDDQEANVQLLESSFLFAYRLSKITLG